MSYWDFPSGSECKESACTAEDPDSIPGSGRSPGEGCGNPLQYSCLGNQNAMALTSAGFKKKKKKYFLSTSSLHSGVGGGSLNNHL